MREEVLRMEHILCKDGEMQELNYLSMQIFKGEIYGVLCLEQHGIDRMLELICWNRPIENGQVFFREKLVNSEEESDNSRNKVTLIGRQSRLIDGLSLADNLFVIREGFKNHIVPDRVIREETRRIFQEIGLRLSPETLVQELGTYDRLVVELLKAVVAGDALIILWEISDLLSAEELPKFHKLIRMFAERGNTFLYIYSHHEVLRLACDRLAIFKGGTIQKVFTTQDTLRTHITKVFARYTYDKLQQLRSDAVEMLPDSPALRIEHITARNIQDFSLAINKGENVLLFDQSNTILDELMDIFRGLERPDTGLCIPDIHGLLKKKRIALIQRDAIHTTLFPELSYLENLCMPLAEKVPHFWQKPQFRRSVLKEYQEEIGSAINAPDLYGVSKKDLYKLVYYRYLIAKPDLVVCLQPLSDMDMYLRGLILDLLSRLRNVGIAVLVLNTELYDTLYIADRLVRVEKGKVTAEYTRAHFDEARMIQEEIFPD